ncbi:MAG: hypothetical protein LBU29_00360 [Endomicrobium sp.]|nr:hypothetical protein [Endomicrobium sp.]
MVENYSCEHTDLSKEIRSQYAFEIRSSKFDENSKMAWAIKQNWKAMIITFIITFASFFAVVKFFVNMIFDCYLYRTAAGTLFAVIPRESEIQV